MIFNRCYYLVSTNYGETIWTNYAITNGPIIKLAIKMQSFVIVINIQTIGKLNELQVHLSLLQGLVL